MELSLRKTHGEVFWKHKYLHKLLCMCDQNPVEVNIHEVTDIKKVQKLQKCE